MSNSQETADQTTEMTGVTKQKGFLSKLRRSKSKDEPAPQNNPAALSKLEKSTGSKKRKDKKDNKASDKNAGDKVRYQDMLEKCEIARDELRDLPAAGVQHREVERLLVAAQVIASAVPFKNNFTAAHSFLEKAKIGDLLERGKENNKKARKTAASTFKVQMDQAAALRSLAAETRSLTDVLQAGFKRRADEAIAPLLTFEPTPQGKSKSKSGTADDTNKEGLADSASNLIMGATNELKILNGQCGAAKMRAEKMKKEIEGLLEALQVPLLTSEEIAEYRLYQRGAETLLGERDYRGAAEALTTLHDTVKDAERGVQKSAVDWQKIVETTLNDLLGRAKALADDTTVPLLKNTAPIAKGSFDTLNSLEAAVKTGDMQRSVAIEAYKNAALEVVSNEYRVSQFKKFAEARKKVESSVNMARDKAIGAIKDLDSAISKFEMKNFNLEKISAKFYGRLVRIDEDFDALKQTAVEPKDLDAKNFIELFNGLAQEVRDAAEPERISELAAEITLEERDAKRAEKQNRLTDSLKRCSDKLDELASIDHGEGKLKQDKFDRLSAMASDSRKRIDRARILIEKLILEIDGVITNRRLDVEKFRQRILVLLELVPSQINEMTTVMNKKGKNDDYKGLIDDFTSRCAELALLAKSSDIEMLEGSKDLAQELLEEIESGISAVNGTDRAGKFVLTVATIRKEIKKRSDKMAKSLLPSYLSVTQATLQGELDEIGELASGLLPLATQAKLSEWDKSYAGAETEALKTKTAHDLLTKSATDIRNRLKSKEFRNAGLFCAAMEARLQGIIDSGRDEDEQNKAQTALSKFHTEIIEAQNVPAIVTNGEIDAKAAKQKKSADQSAWTAMLEIFRARVYEQTSWRSKPRDELMALAKGADKSFETNGDLEAAKKQLGFAARRADFYKKNPEGLELAARQSMPKVVAGWKNAVTGLKAAMDGVTKAVGELPSLDLPDPDKKAVAAEINLMKALINPAAFDSVSAALQDKKRNQDDMRGAREVALAEALRMKDCFEKDSRFAALASNKFDAGTFKAANVEARLHLLKIEKTLLTSL